MNGPGYAKPEPASTRGRYSDAIVGKRDVKWCVKVEERKP